MEWKPDFMDRSEVFGVLEGVWEAQEGWPELSQLQDLVGSSVVSATGAAIRFVAQGPKTRTFEQHYETRIYEKGEVQTRLGDWHDFFNALTWILFPRAKAAVNARHVEALERAKDALYTRPKRSVEEDILSLFNEGGVAVVCSRGELGELLRGFRWKELFWERREETRRCMGFFLFGHALYEKFLDPYVGLTGHSVIYEVEEGFFSRPLSERLAEVDGRMAEDFGVLRSIRSTRDFAPFPLLGFPGLVPENEAEEYYENRSYFRPGRRKL